eukprot:7445727-Ditylum_brightwellii.AAC.1
MDISVDSMLVKEVAMVLKQLSWKLSVEWDCPISQASNCIRTIMSLSIMKTTDYWWQGSCVLPSSINTH